MKCDECGGKLDPKEVEYTLLGYHLGKFNALVCSSCGETLFEGGTLKEIERIAKSKGLWGIAAKTSIGTSGTALDVKIPKALVEFFDLKKGQDVIIEPLDKKRFQVTIS